MDKQNVFIERLTAVVTGLVFFVVMASLMIQTTVLVLHFTKPEKVEPLLQTYMHQ